MSVTRLVLPQRMDPDRIRGAVGQSEESRLLHSLRMSGDENYNMENRAYTTLRSRALAKGALPGCALAAGILTARRLDGPAQGHGTHQWWLRLSIAAAVPLSLGVGYMFWAMHDAARRFYLREREREEWELENFRDGEIDEMVEVYMMRGLTQADARRLVLLLAQSDELLVDQMMMEELHYPPRPQDGLTPFPTPAENLRTAAVATGACAASALTPLLVATTLGDHNVCFQSLPCLGGCVLIGQTMCLSVLQARLVFGAYGRPKDTVTTMRDHMLWLTATVAATAACIKWLQRSS